MTVRPDRLPASGSRSLGRLIRGAVAGTAGVALTMTGVSPVSAQSIDTGSAGSITPTAPGSLLGVPSLSVAALTQLGAPIPLTAVLGSIDAAGSGEFPRPGSSSPPQHPVATRDQSITASAVQRVEPLFPGSPNAVDQRAEVWTVTSKAMQRAIRVEVYRAPAGVDAPNVYFLDGVGSEVPSGWSTGMGWGDGALRARDVNVVVPTGGPSSMWSDWNTDDPVLGPNMWETFLTDELPPLLEQGLGGSARPLAHNGSWGVLGISMGAASALHLTNRYPEMFDAAGGVSGAYSTMDELGYQYSRLTVAARHGDVTNMWGPRGSDEWKRHDTIANPSGLEGKTVFLSAATGLVGSSELGHFGSNEMILIDGHILEKGSYESTKALESALSAVPGVDLQMNYMPTGIHNWPVFVPQMRPAMDHILGGLKAATPNGEVLGAQMAGEALGASGSIGGSLGSQNSVGSSGSSDSVRSGSAASSGS